MHMLSRSSKDITCQTEKGHQDFVTQVTPDLPEIFCKHLCKPAEISGNWNQ